MKEHDVELTLQETEQLCRLYMDCRLTVLEEAELQYVLAKVPYSSPDIDEVRMLTGLAVPTSGSSYDKKRAGRSIRNIRSIRSIRMGAAASLIIIFVAGISILSHKIVNDDNSSKAYIAYADGMKLSGEREARQVKSDMSQAEEFLNHIAELEAEQQQQIDNFIKQIEQ